MANTSSGLKGIFKMGVILVRIKYEGMKVLVSNVKDFCIGKRLYGELFNELSEGIFILDNEHRYADINESGCAMHGYSRDELIGRSVFDVIKIQDTKLLYQMFEKVHNGEKVCRSSVVERRNGEIAYISLKVFKSRGYIICIIDDITDKIKREELLKEYEKNSEILNKTIENDNLRAELFANFSHELRTPLNVIMAATQLQETIYADKFDELAVKSKKYVGVLKQNCYRLLRLVNNILDITKMDAGYYTINLRNINIVSVVEDITQSVVDYAESQGIELVFDTDVEDKIIAADPDRIERIIMNLLSNAVKYTPAGGNIKVTVFDGEDNIEISVKDTGIGISKDKQRNIFDRFIQAHRSLAIENAGSGIGLALVKSLVEMHEGTINLISGPGIGSEFIIKLPCRTVEESMDTQEDNCIGQSRIERVNIEFSDVYK